MPWWFWLFLAWNILNTIAIQILHMTTPSAAQHKLFDSDAGYRPYHAETCPARDAKTSPDRCICGGLQTPRWRPGDASALSRIRAR